MTARPRTEESVLRLRVTVANFGLQTATVIDRRYRENIEAGDVSLICHPEPAETARDLSCDDGVTQAIECCLVKPDSNHRDPVFGTFAESGLRMGDPSARCACLGMTE